MGNRVSMSPMLIKKLIFAFVIVMQIDLMVMCPRLHRERFALESNTYYVKICLYKIQFFFYFYYNKIQ